MDSRRDVKKPIVNQSVFPHDTNRDLSTCLERLKTTPHFVITTSQVGNLVFVPHFNLVSSVLSMVIFLRVSCCFPDEVKTPSIPHLQMKSWETKELSPHLNDIRVRSVQMTVPCHLDMSILKDVFLTEVVIRDVRNCYLLNLGSGHVSDK
jgi:hypothetical protein